MLCKFHREACVWRASRLVHRVITIMILYKMTESNSVNFPYVFQNQWASSFKLNWSLSWRVHGRNSWGRIHHPLCWNQILKLAHDTHMHPSIHITHLPIHLVCPALRWFSCYHKNGILPWHGFQKTFTHQLFSIQRVSLTSSCLTLMSAFSLQAFIADTFPSWCT